MSRASAAAQSAGRETRRSICASPIRESPWAEPAMCAQRLCSQAGRVRATGSANPSKSSREPIPLSRRKHTVLMSSTLQGCPAEPPLRIHRHGPCRVRRTRVLPLTGQGDITSMSLSTRPARRLELAVSAPASMLGVPARPAPVVLRAHGHRRSRARAAPNAWRRARHPLRHSFTAPSGRPRARPYRRGFAVRAH